VTDNFLEEVEGRLRSEKQQDLLVRAIPVAVGAVVLIILAMLAYWGWQTWQHRQMSKASETYAAAMLSAQSGDFAKASQQFGQVGKSAPAAYRSLALQQEAALRLRENKTSEAVALLDQAANADKDPILSDAARLKSALALLDTAPYDQVEKRLTPLLDTKRPYHVAAREALAMARLKAGQLPAARREFSALVNGLDTPDSMRERAQAAVAVIDSGTAGSIGAVLTAKPQMPAMPQMQAPPPGARMAGPPQGAPAEAGAAQ
jgi:hypothetical protein